MAKATGPRWDRPEIITEQKPIYNTSDILRLIDEEEVPYIPLPIKCKWCEQDWHDSDDCPQKPDEDTEEYLSS